MPSPITVYDLENVTDYLGFESFCNDLMACEGYAGIIPIGGTSDRGRDAIHHDPSTDTIFAYSVRDDWRTKLAADLNSIDKHGHICQRVVFVTNANLNAGEYDAQREQAKDQYGWELDVFDIKRIATLVDNTHLALVRTHPSIFKLAATVGNSSGEQFEPGKYCERLLQDHVRSPNEYAMLIAEHREIDTFVDRDDGRGNSERLPVIDIPKKCRVAFVIGESGSGKSTSLWQLTAKYSEYVINGANTNIPILLSLRHWSRDLRCEHLLRDQFSMRGFDARGLDVGLERGEFLILVDGLNEVPRERQSDCYYDLKAFLIQYKSNRFVLTCRNVEYKASSNVLERERPRVPHSVFEISRMERDQIKTYAKDYLRKFSLSSEEFFGLLRIDDDDEWENSSSSIHLVRIPLFLQLYLQAFRVSGALPGSRADLLKTLIKYVVEREITRGNAFDGNLYRRALGHLAIKISDAGCDIQFPSELALTSMSEIFPQLRSDGLIDPNLLVGDLWRGTLSANFLYEDRYNDVSWLHQLIRDYFLGAEFARVWMLGSPQNQSLYPRIERIGIDTTLAVALSLVPIGPGASLLRTLVRLSDENGRRAFEGQSSGARRGLSDELIRRIVSDGDRETRELTQLARALPYLEFAEALDGAFYDTPDGVMQSKLTEGLAEFMMEHQPRVNTQDMFWFDRRDEARLALWAQGVKRCAELLRKHLRGRNESSSFYAAKGLFETDRSAAMDRFRELLTSNDPVVLSLVRDLVDEWNLE